MTFATSNSNSGEESEVVEVVEDYSSAEPLVVVDHHDDEDDVVIAAFSNSSREEEDDVEDLEIGENPTALTSNTDSPASAETNTPNDDACNVYKHQNSTGSCNEKKVKLGGTSSAIRAPPNNNIDDDDDDDNSQHATASRIVAAGIITTCLPRLVLRNRPFFQSKNTLRVQHNKRGLAIFKLLKHNWFHYFLRWPTSRSLLLLMSIWTGSILFFAGLYVAFDNVDEKPQCGLGLNQDEPLQFGTAFAFSLETCTTVGYGLPNGINSFFESGCQTLQILIYFQMAWSMLFNAFLITFIYNRLGRSETRGTQVIYSQKALVSIVNGQIRFQIRVFDADAKYPVVEAHVRLYVVMTERPVPRPLRILQPDDELGGMLWMSFPTVVAHNIDMYSLLYPSSSHHHDHMEHQHYYPPEPSGLILRQVDGRTASRDDVICPICGESYGTQERWINHVRYQQIVEAKDEYPIEGTHLSLNLNEVIRTSSLLSHHSHQDENVEVDVDDSDDESVKDFGDDDVEDPVVTPKSSSARRHGVAKTINKNTKDKKQQTIARMKAYFDKHVSEVICVVEGIDPMQSGTFQALQSYRKDDIIWDPHAKFAPCMAVVRTRSGRGKPQPIFQVDLDRYHDIMVVDPRDSTMNESYHSYTNINGINPYQTTPATQQTQNNNSGGRTTTTTTTSTTAAALMDANTARAQSTRPRYKRVKMKSGRPEDSLFGNDTPRTPMKLSSALATNVTIL